MKRPDVSHLIARVADGDTDAHNELFRLVYDELRRSAQHHVRRSAANLTINPTTLVHETWIKLVRGGPRQFEGNAHFYNVVAQAMRQILHDLAARKAAEKHGGGLARAELTEGIEQAEKPLEELMAIDCALDRLRSCDEELCELVEWHYMVGLTLGEIAQIRSVSDRTLKRQLATARIFLVDALRSG